MNDTTEILQGKECSVAFTLNEQGEAALVVVGEEPLVMYGFVKLVSDLAVQDDMSFEDALAKIKYYHDTCEPAPAEKTAVESIRKGFTIINGKKGMN